jgi:phosphatidylglycerol:prolipoprotein diacylglycerol transferase
MLTLAAYFHDLDPFLVRFSGDFGVRWYGLAYIAGFVAAYLILVRLARRGLILIPTDRVYDAMVWLVLGTIAGGRLGYALFYDPGFRLLTTFSPSFPFWSLLRLNEGGMASHGGMVGLALACWRISRGWPGPAGEPPARAPLLHVMDFVALVAPIGILFGRLANFINGELLGRIVSPPGTPGPWWSVQFPHELTEPARRLQQTPEQWAAIESLAAKSFPRLRPDDALHALAHSAGRFRQELTPLLSSRHPSQLYQALAEGLVLGAILWLLWARPRRPGVVAAAFLIIYGVLRVLTEIVRLPDPQLERIAGLSMGQWLSVVMVLVGAGVLVVSLRSARPPVGGWLTGPTPVPPPLTPPPPARPAA